jgi:hypothetical protein
MNGVPVTITFQPGQRDMLGQALADAESYAGAVPADRGGRGQDGPMAGMTPGGQLA